MVDVVGRVISKVAAREGAVTPDRRKFHRAIADWHYTEHDNGFGKR
jgi:hypothetical protein